MALFEHDLAAIRAAIEKDAAAVRRADWDAITRMFTADAIRFPPHQPPIRGRAAMRAWLETFPPFEEFAITADEIVGGEGLAFVRGTYAMTIGGPTRLTDRGNYMGLMRKQPDGSLAVDDRYGRVRAASSDGVIFDPGSSRAVKWRLAVAGDRDEAPRFKPLGGSRAFMRLSRGA